MWNPMIVLLLRHLVVADLERDLLQVGATPLKKTFVVKRYCVAELLIRNLD